MANLNLGLNATLPGELVVKAIFDYASIHRETMSQPVRDEWDKRLLQAYDDCRALWVRIGVLS